VVLLLGLGALALVPGLAKLQVNDDFVAYFDEDLPFRQAAEIADEHLAGMYEIEYQLVAPESGGIHDPEWLAQVDAFTAWLRAQPETAHVLSWTDVLERLHRVMSDGGAEAGRLPPDAPTASQYTLLYELSLPLGLDLTNLIAQDYGSVRQLVTLRNMDSRRVLEFEERADAWLAEHAPDVGQRHGGINLMFAHISERNVAAMFEGNLLAVGVIALVLAAALRSLTLAAGSLVTNLVPVLGAFAIWGWLSGDLGLALSTAFGMTLGIVVDDTVHLLSRFQRSRAAGMSPAEAVRTAVTAVGPALVITTGILLLGFACLASSSFAINGLLARITMLTIGLALVFDLLLLPALLAGRQSGDRARVEG
jgi:predicted RND superfamily exporter protein